MAHNININRVTGKASFASKQVPAWHGLGTVVNAMTSSEAIVLGGLDFRVEKRSLLVEGQNIVFDEAKQHTLVCRSRVNENGIVSNTGNKSQFCTLNPIYDKFATVRVDNNLPLGIVGSKYEVIQNYEAFDFIDSIIGEGIADYETVGALGNGETVFITCKLREEMVINKDLINKYLLITMSHDGTSSIVVRFTPIRVVCNNTLTLALQGTSNKVTIKHTLNARAKLEASKKVLGIIDKQTFAYKEALGHLATVPVNDIQFKHIVEKSFGLNRDRHHNLSQQGINIIRNVNRYYQEGVGQEGIVGTGYGVFNGITGYLQNVKEYKNAEVRFKNTYIGTEQVIRDKAYELITQL